MGTKNRMYIHPVFYLFSSIFKSLNNKFTTSFVRFKDIYLFGGGDTFIFYLFEMLFGLLKRAILNVCISTQ